VTVRHHDRPRFWPYLGRFTLVHVATYAAVASVFLAVQRALPVVDRVTLDYFVPYRPIGALTLAGQVGRGVILALVLYPFVRLVLRAARGRLILFGALWGTAIVVDGLWREWLIVGTPEVTVQMLVFAVSWWAWERRAARRRSAVPARA
jgi:hypothetical protein